MSFGIARQVDNAFFSLFLGCKCGLPFYSLIHLFCIILCSGNLVGHEAAVRLSRALKVNTTLTDLNLRMDDDDTEGRQAIAKAWNHRGYLQIL